MSINQAMHTFTGSDSYAMSRSQFPTPGLSKPQKPRTPYCCRSTSHTPPRASASSNSYSSRRRSAPPPPKFTQPLSPSQSFVTDLERAAFSAEQVVFLERKRRAAAGLGPLLPPSSYCSHCTGSGKCQCPECNGTGMNQYDKLEEAMRITDEDADADGVITIHQTNGLIDTTYFFRENTPCWLCRGKMILGCKHCEGTGFANINLFTCD